VSRQPRPPGAPSRPYPCPSCDKSYSSVKSLQCHKEILHGRPYARKCTEKENCGIIFTDRRKFYEHRNRHHGHIPIEREVKCTKCCSKFASMKEFMKHRKDEGNCEEKKNENCMKASEVKITCEYCDEIFKDERKVKSHRLIVHGAGSNEDGHLQCEYCLKFYNHTSGMRYHKRLIHFNCPVHLRRDYSGLSEESRFDLKVETIKCHVCKGSEICASVQELKEHERTEEHDKEVKAKIAIHCNVCRESFNGNSKAFKDHLESEGHAKELESLGEFNAAEFCIPCRVVLGEGESAWNKHNLSASHRTRCEFKEKAKEKLRLECPDCPMVFELQSRFDRHLKEKHGTDVSKDNIKSQVSFKCQ